MELHISVKFTRAYRVSRTKLVDCLQPPWDFSTEPEREWAKQKQKGHGLFRQMNDRQCAMESTVGTVWGPLPVSNLSVT